MAEKEGNKKEFVWMQIKNFSVADNIEYKTIYNLQFELSADLMTHVNRQRESWAIKAFKNVS